MSKIVLSERLRGVANMVTPGSKLVDVGCDHGYLPIVLVEEEICPKALCCDVNKGPLAAAEEHISQHLLCIGKIGIRLSDGLMNLTPGEGDSLVIAGMGGGLMVRILKGKPEVRKSFRELILQPQSEINLVRGFLEEAHYVIVREDMVKEEGKYYPMMKAVPGPEENGKTMAPWELEYGPLLLRERNPVLLEFLQGQRMVKADILEKLESNGSGGARIEERIRQVEYEIFLINKALNCYMEGF